MEGCGQFCQEHFDDNIGLFAEAMQLITFTTSKINPTMEVLTHLLCFSMHEKFEPVERLESALSKIKRGSSYQVTFYYESPDFIDLHNCGWHCYMNTEPFEMSDQLVKRYYPDVPDLSGFNFNIDKEYVCLVFNIVPPQTSFQLQNPELHFSMGK
jgi:hypothetical protein